MTNVLNDEIKRFSRGNKDKQEVVNKLKKWFIYMQGLIFEPKLVKEEILIDARTMIDIDDAFNFDFNNKFEEDDDEIDTTIPDGDMFEDDFEDDFGDEE